MIRIKASQEYEVWCKDCQKTIVYDSPRDLRKKYSTDFENNPMFRIICPRCRRKIWFDNTDGITMDPSFIEQVEEGEVEHAIVVRKPSEDVLDLLQKGATAGQKESEGETFSKRFARLLRNEPVIGEVTVTDENIKNNSKALVDMFDES